MEASLVDQTEKASCVESECSPLLQAANDASAAASLPLHSPQPPDACAKNTQQLILDGKGCNWHQSPIIAPQDKERKSADSLPILDFDLLCATIAMQREPLSVDIQRDACEAGVQRMWEGGVLDCFENREIALRTFCCPSVTYGKNLDRAGFGSCIAKGGIHFLLLAVALVSYILFLCAYGHQYLYTAIAAVICVALYASYYRIQIRRRFNIKGSDLDGVVSAIDDSLNHFICGCCALCQRKLALRLLSQDCSTGPAERNWSTWALFHTKKRNKLSPLQLERLVYCHCNLKLLESKGNHIAPLQVNVDNVDIAKVKDIPEIPSEERDIYSMLFRESQRFVRQTRSHTQTRRTSVVGKPSQGQASTSRARKFTSRRGRGRGARAHGGTSRTRPRDAEADQQDIEEASAESESDYDEQLGAAAVALVAEFGRDSASESFSWASPFDEEDDGDDDSGDSDDAVGQSRG